MRQLTHSPRQLTVIFWLACGLVWSELGIPQSCGQESAGADTDVANSAPFVVSDQSLSIDSATLVSPKLRELAETSFTEASLSEVARWLQSQTGLNVALDQLSLAEVGVDENSPVSDTLRKQPIYLLLDRLAQQKIGWRLEGSVLRLYGLGDASMLRNVQYNAGDLLDQKFEADDLEEVILSVVEAGSGWTARDDQGEGDLIFLGDVLFIRQDERTHRRIAGLLAALRGPARRVLVDDPAEHAAIRAALGGQISVRFKAKPFGAVVAELADKAGVDMRLDAAALSSTKVNERTPVTFELKEQRLQTTLDLLLGQFGLSWILRDGVLWVTTREAADRFLQTAVFDVRDICPNLPASEALSEALLQQVDTGSWGDQDGAGQIVFAKPGVMVVRQSERRLDAVEELLGNYRVALKNSKRRISEDEDPEFVVTRYYRMPAEVAAEMERVLPELVASESWKSSVRPEAAGTIRQVHSWPEVSETTKGGAVLMPQATLIISQKRKHHDEVRKFLDNIKYGNSLPSGFGGAGMGGAGVGGAGMGGAGMGGAGGVGGMDEKSGKMPSGGGIF